MSAITGIFYRDGRKVDPDLIKKMNDKLSHRGPDGSDIWCEGSVALGHQMLWTTPESLHEKLPFEEDGLVITADARIDNRDELSEELEIPDEEHISDSYFILKAYQKWGEDCPDKLLGDFAFAIWDQNKKKLFCARDHMGVKPFYYYLDDEKFVFGTEIKAILSISSIHFNLNEKKLLLYLTKELMDYTQTFYEKIYCLPASHFYLINTKKDTISKYWELNPKMKTLLGSEEEYKKAFLNIFSEAIRCRIRSSFPIGFNLSGGLDSSSIVCTTRKVLMDKKDVNIEFINTFSTVYNEIPESDERYYISKVLENDKIKSNFLFGDNNSPLKDIENILWFQDQPFISPHIVNDLQLYRKMKSQGIRVNLSGDGGDEIISHGGNYLRELLFSFKLKKFLKELYEYSNRDNYSKFKIIFSEVILTLIPYSLKKYIRLIFKRNKISIVNEKLLKEFEINKFDLDDLLDYLSKLDTKKYHYFTINNPLNQTIFGIMNRSSARYNIEGRYPFFDKRLVEFCYSLPTEMKIKYGWDRYIMRISMNNILPPEIQWRQKKADLNHVYKRNIILFEKPTIEKIIYNTKTIQKYLDTKKIQKSYEKYKLNNKKSLFDIWLVLVAYFWLKSKNFEIDD
ncbi:lasso peptide isopeptide bond-forming cyclase [Methanobacterium alcaliphilum]|uniref:lasso peptide isopeptide bond-forming cyclase n=1 Tax=Methanobacterium alcaliphilum TaxID=392018 RepID=UPI00200B5A50|nr:lasso peptide isopeptide bond-forming cyclase [Methanobacterium alcaliphilum]MCK9150761.1 lasso peptide isopeptide bond-forming cyclase [Methanobacterium alcaliphilum]